MRSFIPEHLQDSNGLSSPSRRLEKETKRNIAVMWLLKKLPLDHKTIVRFWSENNEALKSVFRDFVKLCLGIGLYVRELAAIDGSKFRVANSTDRNPSATELNVRIKRLSLRIDEYMQQLNEMDAAEANNVDVATSNGIKQIIDRLSNRKNSYDSYLEEFAASGEIQKSLTYPDGG